jgi:gamma-glutamyltranspeptidase/glutathione hydrolase
MRIALIACLAFVLTACASAGGGALAAPERLAADEGARILRRGGNAADAAVCVGFVLAVTHPAAGNLGGGGFILVHSAEEDAVIDAREIAPRAARRDMYLDEQGDPIPDASLVGPLAAGVPGSVAGYARLHSRYGTMDWAELLEPAIRLAEEGFSVSDELRASLERHRELLIQFPETARIFLPGGEVADTLRQPELAKVLRAIAERGPRGFYEGWVAESLAETCARYGGRITVGDLYTYESKLRAPLRGRYRGYDVVTMPPPSSGGVVLLQMLGMLERGRDAGMLPTQHLHFFTEVSRRAFADRSFYFGDPDFVEVPVEQLLDPEYLRARFESIVMTRATPSSEVRGGLPLPDSEETCHFSVVDKDGNAVSCTTTLNGAYGCGLAASGVLLNNEMDDFTIKPGVPNQFGLIQSARNAIEPRKRPLSSMTPTIVLEGNRPVLVLGSPGGPKIISAVCQVIARHLGQGVDLEEAVATPRVHCQWLPDEVLTEELPRTEIEALERLGHRLRRAERPIGDVQAVGRTRQGKPFGVSDPRGQGAAR